MLYFFILVLVGLVFLFIQFIFMEQKCQPSVDMTCGRPPSYGYLSTVLRNSKTLTSTFDLFS